MKKQKVMASAKKSGRKVIKASKSVDQMLDAFESKLAEFGIESCDNVAASNCDVEGSEVVEAGKVVFITDSDRDELYEDIGGGFGEVGEVYSLADLKNMWNSMCDSDPSMSYYGDFGSWLSDTIGNGFLEEVDEIESCDVTASIELTPDEEDKLWEIADQYNTSHPVSGDWDAEVAHEMQTIADVFDITSDEAKELMIKYLGFSEEEVS